MIDRGLNYGRDQIRGFLQKAAPFESILDLGAGQGDDLLMAKDVCPATRLLALEGYPPYVEVLKGKGIEVFTFDLERAKFPFADESLEVIMINQVMEHVKDVFWILHEVTRVLKTGGHFIVGVPNLAAFHNRILLALGKQPSSLKNDSAHVRGYTKGDFLNLINAGFSEGYSIDGFKGSNFYPFPPSLAKPLASLFPTLSVGIFFDLKKNKPYKGKGYLDYPVTESLETKFYLG
jgi:SAM-dependent methyltransferase